MSATIRSEIHLLLGQPLIDVAFITSKKWSSCYAGNSIYWYSCVVYSCSVYQPSCQTWREPMCEISTNWSYCISSCLLWWLCWVLVLRVPGIADLRVRVTQCKIRRNWACWIKHCAHVLTYWCVPTETAIRILPATLSLDVGNSDMSTVHLSLSLWYGPAFALSLSLSRSLSLARVLSLSLSRSFSLFLSLSLSLSVFVTVNSGTYLLFRCSNFVTTDLCCQY